MFLLLGFLPLLFCLFFSGWYSWQDGNECCSIEWAYCWGSKSLDSWSVKEYEPKWYSKWKVTRAVSSWIDVQTLFSWSVAGQCGSFRRCAKGSWWNSQRGWLTCCDCPWSSRFGRETPRESLCTYTFQRRREKNKGKFKTLFPFCFCLSLYCTLLF